MQRNLDAGRNSRAAAEDKLPSSQQRVKGVSGCANWMVTVDAVRVSEFSRIQFYGWSDALSRLVDEILFARKDDGDSRFRIPCALFGPSPT